MESSSSQRSTGLPPSSRSHLIRAPEVVEAGGKLRDTLHAPRGLDRAAAEELALASEKVQRQLAGATPRKVIVVPDRLVHIVA